MNTPTPQPQCLVMILLYKRQARHDDVFMVDVPNIDTLKLRVSSNHYYKVFLKHITK